MQPIGIRTSDGFAEILPSSTKIGEEVTVPYVFFPNCDYADELLISFFQGDWERFEGQSYIGTVKLKIPKPDTRENIRITLKMSYNQDCLICLRVLLNNEEICYNMIHDRWHNPSPHVVSQNQVEEKSIIRDIQIRAETCQDGEKIINQLAVLQNERRNNLITEEDYLIKLRELYELSIKDLSTTICTKKIQK